MAKTRKSYKLRRYKTRRNKNKRNKKTLRKGLRKRRKTKKNLRGGETLSVALVDDRIKKAEAQFDSLNKEQLEKLKTILDSTSGDIADGVIKKKDGGELGPEAVNVRKEKLREITKKVQDKLDGLNKPPSGGPEDTDPEKVPPPSEEPVQSASELGSSKTASPSPSEPVQ